MPSIPTPTKGTKAASLDFGHDECCGGKSVLTMTGNDFSRGSQSRLDSVGARWLDSSSNACRLSGLAQGLPPVLERP